MLLLAGCCSGSTLLLPLNVHVLFSRRVEIDVGSSNKLMLDAGGEQVAAGPSSCSGGHASGWIRRVASAAVAAAELIGRQAPGS